VSVESYLRVNTLTPKGDSAAGTRESASPLMLRFELRARRVGQSADCLDARTWGTPTAPSWPRSPRPPIALTATLTNAW